MTINSPGRPVSVTTAVRVRVYATIAIVAFAAESSFAALHLFEGGGHAGFDYWPHDPIVDTILLLAWVGGALGFLLRRWWCLYLCTIGAFASVAQGLVFALSKAFVGLPFFVAGALQFACLIKAGQSFLRRTPGSPESTR